MATACSFLEGQDVMACQLCEETHEIKWKCMTCEFLMCTRCCKIHQKVKSTGDHDVVNIKDISLRTEEPETKKEFTKTACRTHDGQICCLFCQDCNGVVCPLCIAGTHNKHKMEEINKRYKFCVEKLQEVISKLDQESKDLEQDNLTLESIRSTEENKFGTVKENILYQDKAIKDAVDQQTKKLLNDLDEKWGSVDKSISSQKTKLSQRNHYMEEEKNRIQRALTSENIEEVFQVGSEHVEEKRTNISNERLCYVKETIPHFIKGDINQSKMESIHGRLSNEQDESAADKIKFELEEKYSTNYSNVKNILSCEDGSLWITHSKMLENIRLSNGDVYSNRSYTVNTNDIALMPNGDLLISTGRDELRIIPKTTGQIKITQFKLDPNQSSAGLHITRDRKIIVGAFIENKAGRKGQVVVFNMNGKKEKVFSRDNKRTLFTSPTRITTDSKNNIYIIDILSEAEGRLVMLDQWGGVKAIYTGHPIENKNNPMIFGNLVVTKSDNIIITEFHNNALHILNNEGKCIAYKSLADLGILQSISLDIDNRGLLVIGCWGLQCKFYFVKFFGC